MQKKLQGSFTSILKTTPRSGAEVPQKPATSKTFNRADEIELLICKYLKFMEFVRSASPNTLRAYQRELRSSLLDMKSKQNEENPAPAPFSAEKLDIIDADLLLTRATKALSLAAERGLSAPSRARKAHSFKSFFHWLFSEGHIDQDIAFRIRAPKQPQKLPRHLSVDESLAMFEKSNEAQSLAGDSNSSARQLLFLLLYGCGLRVSEACRLKIVNFESENRSLRVTGKGDKQRLVPMPQIVHRALINHLNSSQLRLHPDHFVLSRSETALSTTTAYSWIKKLGAETGLLRHTHPHLLRHSFATQLLRSGADIREIQELLGHSSLAATARYTHVSIDHLAKSLESNHPLESIEAERSLSGQKGTKKESNA